MNDPRRNLSSANTGNLWVSIRNLASAILDGIIRMSATRANYWLEFVFTGAFAIILLGTGVGRHNGSWLAAFLTVLAGLFVFSFIEYVCHRWIFHGPDSMYRRGHDAHHLDPRGYDGLPFFLPSVILLGLTLFFALLMPGSHACLLGGAIAFAYLGYGLSHYVIHATRFRQPWLRHWASRHHIHHHHADGNFGVTTPLWDHLFGTRYDGRKTGG